MKRTLFLINTICMTFLQLSCTGQAGQKDVTEKSKDQKTELPAPSKSHMNFSEVIGWQEGETPKAPEGFKVVKYASGLKSPRWAYEAPNGDILVAQSNTEVKGIKKVAADVIGASESEHVNESANQIMLFRDTDNNGMPDMQEMFLCGITQPFGMLILNNSFYVAATDGVWKYPYKTGEIKLEGKGIKILELPGSGRHWARNIIANKEGTKLYVSVGSSSDHAENGIEKENRRACIIEINPDGSGEKIYADGLRNPVGMDWEPSSNVLWTVVNERDQLGDQLVPDYLTGVKENGFYGWPYSYFGQHKDPRIKNKEQRPDLVNKAIVPDLQLGSHTASLGLAFYKQNGFPEKYKNGAFIGQHGSWNSSKLVGYKVVFVPFKNGKPSGSPEDFLTGFIIEEGSNRVHGRPVGVTVLKGGSLLVMDDASDTIWKITYNK
jgi:glucose/arabinose dehydrogenase